jgi:hypothetical protein
MPLNKVLPPFLPKFQQPGCDEIFTTSHFDFPALAEIFHERVIAESRNSIVQWAAQHFLTFQLHGAFLRQPVPASCNDFITTFGIQKPTSQGMAKPCDEKWGSSN